MRLNQFTDWLASGERGMSSEAIVTRLTGVKVGRHSSRLDYPQDPDDFRRCQLLIREVPTVRRKLTQMRGVSPKWAALVDTWDEIHSAIEEEVPGYMDGAQGKATKGYALMRKVIEGARAKA